LVILDKPAYEPDSRSQDEGKDHFEVANEFFNFINF
jgi:hypothetical protein